MPEKLDRCVKSVMADDKSESSAHAICNDSIKSAKATVKMSKEEVKYGPHDPGSQCGECFHYNEGKCKIVEGDIRPELGCDLFQPMMSLTAKFTQNPDFPEPNIDIVTGEKKKTGFFSLIHTQIGSMISMLDKMSQSGS